MTTRKAWTKVLVDDGTIRMCTGIYEHWTGSRFAAMRKHMMGARFELMR